MGWALVVLVFAGFGVTSPVRMSDTGKRYADAAACGHAAGDLTVGLAAMRDDGVYIATLCLPVAEMPQPGRPT